VISERANGFTDSFASTENVIAEDPLAGSLSVIVFHTGKLASARASIVGSKLCQCVGTQAVRLMPKRSKDGD
jgi:hypothetical protein